jgi:hypothetical protein
VVPTPAEEETTMADEERVKVTLNLPGALVRQAKHAAIDRDCNLQDLVEEGLRFVLAKRKGAKS